MQNSTPRQCQEPVQLTAHNSLILVSRASVPVHRNDVHDDRNDQQNEERHMDRVPQAKEPLVGEELRYPPHLPEVRSQVIIDGAVESVRVLCHQF